MNPPVKPAESTRPIRANRLQGSSSPYLLQHQHNPVEWFPWGEEAFAEARRRDVPVFLSIGYSTCYWCHVMERESFENPTIAAQLNRDFVCVKVDREERPDVDDVHMAALQAFLAARGGGGGGWPMSVFLEPQTLKPFWAGTYLPPEPRFAGIPSFPELLSGIARAWQEQREDVLNQAVALAEAAAERVSIAVPPELLGAVQVTQAVSELLQLHDRLEGGFGPAPKFPQPVFLELLLDAREVADDATRVTIDAALRLTLDKMALGGLNDQVGGGFHRYSVDGRWLVPHFEKMLYDNALLISVYARAAAVYGDEFYRRTVERTVEFLLRDMRGVGAGQDHGKSEPVRAGFFSALDAEVNHREGQNYLWTMEQIRAELPSEDAEFAASVYGLVRNGRASQPNFRDPHHPDDPPSNVLALQARPETLAAASGLGEKEFLDRLDRVNRCLLESRRLRDQPAVDDKVLTAWNGLAIGALATAGAVLDRPEWIAAAVQAAEFVLQNLTRRAAEDEGNDPGTSPSVFRSFRKASSNENSAGVPGFLEDYAVLAHGLVQLHRSVRNSNGRYIEAAQRFVAEADRLFSDPSGSGAFFDVREASSDLFVRTRSVHDGAVPCGTSIMLHTLVDLFQILGERKYLGRAASCLVGVSGAIAASPLAAAGSTRALLRLLRTDASVLASAFGSVGARATPNAPAEAENADPVEILSAVEKVVLEPGKPVGIVLRMRIAPPYHINAAEAVSGGMQSRDPDVIPLRVKIINGTGVAAYADYPPGKPFGQDGRLRVLSGEFDLPVVLEREGEWSGRPLLAVTCQACTEAACLRPRTVELDIALDRK